MIWNRPFQAYRFGQITQSPTCDEEQQKVRVLRRTRLIEPHLWRSSAFPPAVHDKTIKIKIQEAASYRRRLTSAAPVIRHVRSILSYWRHIPISAQIKIQATKLINIHEPTKTSLVFQIVSTLPSSTRLLVSLLPANAWKKALKARGVKIVFVCSGVSLLSASTSRIILVLRHGFGC